MMAEAESVKSAPVRAMRRRGMSRVSSGFRDRKQRTPSGRMAYHVMVWKSSAGREMILAAMAAGWERKFEMRVCAFSG